MFDMAESKLKSYMYLTGECRKLRTVSLSQSLFLCYLLCRNVFGIVSHATVPEGVHYFSFLSLLKIKMVSSEFLVADKSVHCFSNVSVPLF
jgi:hypothetical protein